MIFHKGLKRECMLMRMNYLLTLFDEEQFHDDVSVEYHPKQYKVEYVTAIVSLTKANRQPLKIKRLFLNLSK